MLKRLKRNLGYKLLALGLGILLYAVAFAQSNPRTSREVFVTPEAIEIVNLPDNLILRALPSQVMVSARGPLSAIEDYRASAIKARVDLSQSKRGRNRVPISYRHDSGRLDIIGPAYVDITLEKKVRVTYTVDALYNDTPPPGYTYAEPIVSPRTVQVMGLETDVRRVARVVASVDNGTERGNLVQTVELEAQTDQQDSVDMVQIEPPRVTVTLALKKAASTKSLLLTASFQGRPASGFALVRCEFDPQSVEVKGLQSTLARRSSLVVPINVSGMRESETRSVPLRLPPGVELQNAKQNRVQVRLDIVPIQVSGLDTAPTPTPTVAATPTPVPIPRRTPEPILLPTPTPTPDSPEVPVNNE